MEKTLKDPHSKCLSPKGKILGEEVRKEVVVVVDSGEAEVVAAEVDVEAVVVTEEAAAQAEEEGVHLLAIELATGDALIPVAEIPTFRGERPATDVTRPNQRVPEKTVRLVAAADVAEVDLQVAVGEVGPAVAVAAAGAVAEAAGATVAEVTAGATGVATGVAAAGAAAVMTAAMLAL